MMEESVREGGWLRLLGLLALSLTLSVGQPFILVVVAFAMLTFLAPGGRILVLLLTAGAFAAIFAGGASEGLWYLERGWAILVGGWFVAFSLFLPGRPFLARALPSLLGSIVCVGGILATLGSWSTVETLVAERVEVSMTATLQLMNALAEGDLQVGLMEAMSTTARVQGVLFPALLGLSSLTSLGVAWWLHVRVSPLEGPGFGLFREFRFPDPLIWIFIAGLGLVLVAGWSVGWGRLGMNLVAFMGALYVLRGVAVLIVLWGGVSFTGGLLLTLALVLAGPLVALGVMLVGVSDSWFDLRTRVERNGPAVQ